MQQQPPPQIQPVDALRALASGSVDFGRSVVGEGPSGLGLAWVRLTYVSALTFPVLGMVLFFYSFSDPYDLIEWWMGLAVIVFAPLGLCVIILINSLTYYLVARASRELQEATYLARHDGDAAEANAPQPAASATTTQGLPPAAAGGAPSQQLALEVQPGSSVAGALLGSLALPEAAAVTSVIRDGEASAAQPDTVLAVGDLVVVSTPIGTEADVLSSLR